MPPPVEGGRTLTVARNVSTRYLALGVEAALGIVLLPFNVSHLGQAAYGLWMLTASITAYFTVLDLGYGGALVKFVAEYRARGNQRSLNEIVSTTFGLFAAIGALTYLAAIGVAFNLDRIFQLTADQVQVGRAVLLIISANVAVGMAFSVFGAVINGFQRYDLNNIVGTIGALLNAVVNVAVLSLGFGLIALVAATTSVRLLTYIVYRANAYRVFPGLRLRASLFRAEHVKQMTRFSLYISVIDWANRLHYSVSALIVGAFMNTAAVAVWAVGQRVAEMVQRLSYQLNDVLFPAVVDCDATSRTDRLQSIFVQGTRLSLATVIPLAGALALLARPLVDAWVGSEFRGSVIVIQLLLATVVVQIGTATANTLLKGAGGHRVVAAANGATTAASIASSIAVAGQLGLAGIAVATFLPVLILSTLVSFPAACRRVELPVSRAIALAVWPAVWPAAIMILYVTATRQFMGRSLAAVGFEIATAAFVYVATFFFVGITPGDRRLYLAQAGALAARLRLQLASEGA